MRVLQPGDIVVMDNFGYHKSVAIRQIYRSAQLRTLAVAEWGVPFRVIAPFAAYNVPILPDLFELEPQPRPRWLPTLDASEIEHPVNLPNLTQVIIASQLDDKWQAVQL